MHNNVYNEFVLDVSTKSGTDWVVTFPTKREYVFAGSGVAQKLFQNNFTATGSCDDVVLTQYDREERTIVSQSNVLAAAADADGLAVLGSQRDLVRLPGVVVHAGAIDGPRLEELLGREDRLRERLGLAELPARFGTRHQLVGPGSTVFNTRTGGTIGTTSTHVQRSAGHRLRRDHVRERHAVARTGTAIQSNYGGNFNHKVTTSIAPVSNGFRLYSGARSNPRPFFLQAGSR